MILIIFAFLMFGFPFLILNKNRHSYKDNFMLNGPTNIKVVDMVINQYLLALGEFASLDAFEKGPQTILTYFFFVLSTFIVQIVMFNMLIAIMGDTFDKITENRDVNAIKSKLELMSELVALLGVKDLEENREIFMFIVQVLKEDGDEDEDELDEDSYVFSVCCCVLFNKFK